MDLIVYPDIVFLCNALINILTMFCISNIYCNKSFYKCIICGIILSLISTTTYILFFNTNIFIYKIIYATTYVLFICSYFKIFYLRKILFISLICFYFFAIVYGIRTVFSIKQQYVNYVIITIFIIYLLRKIKLYKQKNTYNLIYHECLLKIQNKTIQTTTLTDTGNTLITPFSKEPVIILDPCILCKFIPRQIIDEYVKTNYFDYKKANELTKIYFFPLPYKTISNNFNLLPVFKINNFIIPNCNINSTNLYAGISKTCLSKKHTYNSIIGLNVLTQKEDNSND